MWRRKNLYLMWRFKEKNLIFVHISFWGIISNDFSNSYNNIFLLLSKLLNVRWSDLFKMFDFFFVNSIGNWIFFTDFQHVSSNSPKKTIWHVYRSSNNDYEFLMTHLPHITKRDFYINFCITMGNSLPTLVPFYHYYLWRSMKIDFKLTSFRNKGHFYYYIHVINKHLFNDKTSLKNQTFFFVVSLCGFVSVVLYSISQTNKMNKKNSFLEYQYVCYRCE